MQHPRSFSKQPARVAALGMAMLGMVFSPKLARAIDANPSPAELTQPDGTKITLRLRGDEWLNWLEDSQGYAVVMEQGSYVYATLNTEGLLSPTALAVGHADPAATGLRKGL